MLFFNPFAFMYAVGLAHGVGRPLFPDPVRREDVDARLVDVRRCIVAEDARQADPGYIRALREIEEALEGDLAKLA